MSRCWANDKKRNVTRATSGGWVMACDNLAHCEVRSEARPTENDHPLEEYAANGWFIGKTNDLCPNCYSTKKADGTLKWEPHPLMEGSSNVLQKETNTMASYQDYVENGVFPEYTQVNGISSFDENPQGPSDQIWSEDARVWDRTKYTSTPRNYYYGPSCSDHECYIEASELETWQLARFLRRLEANGLKAVPNRVLKQDGPFVIDNTYDENGEKTFYHLDHTDQAILTAYVWQHEFFGERDQLKSIIEDLVSRGINQPIQGRQTYDHLRWKPIIELWKVGKGEALEDASGKYVTEFNLDPSRPEHLFLKLYDFLNGRWENTPSEYAQEGEYCSVPVSNVDKLITRYEQSLAKQKSSIGLS